jgi:hypothetical protein
MRFLLPVVFWGDAEEFERVRTVHNDRALDETLALAELQVVSS